MNQLCLGSRRRGESRLRRSATVGTLVEAGLVKGRPDELAEPATDIGNAGGSGGIARCSSAPRRPTRISLGWVVVPVDGGAGDAELGGDLGPTVNLFLPVTGSVSSYMRRARRICWMPSFRVCLLQRNRFRGRHELSSYMSNPRSANPVADHRSCQFCALVASASGPTNAARQDAARVAGSADKPGCCSQHSGIGPLWSAVGRYVRRRDNVKPSQRPLGKALADCPGGWSTSCRVIPAPRAELVPGSGCVHPVTT